VLPFRTVAIKPGSPFDYGKVILVEQLKGRVVRLPDGSYARHDGLFFTGDTGSGIEGNHFDFYTGFGREAQPVEGILPSNGATLKAVEVNSPELVDILNDLHQLSSIPMSIGDDALPIPVQ
jgi:hypothetical protein